MAPIPSGNMSYTIPSREDVVDADIHHVDQNTCDIRFRILMVVCLGLSGEMTKATTGEPYNSEG